MLAVLVHFLVGAVGGFLISAWAAHKTAESNGSAPAAGMVTGLTCASLAHFLSPWATPVVLSLVVLASIYEARLSRRIPRKRNNDE